MNIYHYQKVFEPTGQDTRFLNLRSLTVCASPDPRPHTPLGRTHS